VWVRVGIGPCCCILRRDLGALLKALRPTESRLSGRKNRPTPWTYIYIIHVQGREDRDEIIIKIINRIYKIFFPPFLYEYNSKNGRNRKILYCKYKIENDSRRPYTNKYMPFFFCFVLFRFFFFFFLFPFKKKIFFSYLFFLFIFIFFFFHFFFFILLLFIIAI